MFAYCGNDPVARFDPTGQSWWTDFWQDVKEWLEEKKEEAESNINVTAAKGKTLSGALAIALSLSYGITADTKGNVGLIITLNGGGGFPSAGVGGYASVNNAPTIYYQEGLGTAIGGSGGPGFFAVGVDYNILIDKDNDCAYHGATFTGTVGLYPTIVEAHGEVGYTWVFGINLYDVGIAIADFLSGRED